MASRRGDVPPGIHRPANAGLLGDACAALEARASIDSGQPLTTRGDVCWSFADGGGLSRAMARRVATSCALVPSGAMGLTLPQYLAAKEQGAVRPEADERSCIMIFNLGAPSQLDTFDMKPNAPAEVRGPFRPINTVAPEIQLSEILPRHAEVADKFSLVRSCYHTSAAVHDAGWQMMQTGRQFTGGVETPHAGAVVSYLRGRRSDLPPFVVLPELMGRGGGNLPNGQAGGFLGKAYDPFALMADPSQPNFKVPDLLPPPDIGLVRVERRRRLRAIVEETLGRFEASDDARLLDENFQAAYRLMTSTQARQAFDLAQEKPAVRERYGMNRFGQCCLLARRLIEAGVRFVTINTFLTVFDEITWDIHGSKPFTSIEGMRDIVAPMYDQAYSALIEDLDQRGMLDIDAGQLPGGIRSNAESQPGRRSRSLAAMFHRELCRRWRERRPSGRGQRSDRWRSGRSSDGSRRDHCHDPA